MTRKAGNITIWLNAFKKKEDQPDFRGKIDVDGNVYTLSLWTNLFVSGSEFPINLSGQIHEGEEE